MESPSVSVLQGPAPTPFWLPASAGLGFFLATASAGPSRSPAKAGGAVSPKSLHPRADEGGHPFSAPGLNGRSAILDSLEARFQAWRYNDRDRATRARHGTTGMKTCIASVLLALLQADGTFFTTDLTVEEMETKQAVVETSMGTFVIEFLPRVAPNHVGYFLKLASEGAYDGTTFHRVIVTHQPSLDGQYTLFGRVLEGIDVVQASSEIPADEKTIATERVEIVSVTVRDAPSSDLPDGERQQE